MKSQVKPYIAGIIYSSIFGFSFIVTKTAIANIEPFHFLGLRFLFAALGVTVLSLFGLFPVNLKNKPIMPLIFLALFEPVGYFVGETYGLSLVDSSIAGMMIALIPIFVAIFGYLFLKERINYLQTASIIISVAGVILITMMKQGQGGGNDPLGYLYVLFAVLAAAGFSIFSRKLSTNYNPYELTLVMMWVGAIVFNIFALIKVGAANYFVPLAQAEVQLGLLYLAFGSSIVAFALMNYTLAVLPVARATVFSNLTTVVAVFAGAVFGNEALTIYHFIGGFMILAGVVGVNHFGRSQALSSKN